MGAPTKAFAVYPVARPGTRLIKPSPRQCQLDSPDEVVKFTWRQISTRRNAVSTVLDLGAGDGRFAEYGDYERYVGYEVDARRVPSYATTNYRVILADALTATGLFDVAIGNPPYIRNQDLRESWRKKAVALIERETGIEADLRANLYVYFMWLALLRTKADGLIAQIVPADWLVRPSARRIREYIKSKGWHLSAYVFDDARGFFRDVKTNLTLTVIDKASAAPWRFFSVTSELKVVAADEGSELRDALTPFPQHVRRFEGLRASRGLSPGDQKVFVLTEAERIANGISRSSVWPCVTTLRNLPPSVRTLDEDSFERHFVAKGKRCWLLKTSHAHVAAPVLKWLKAAPKNVRENWTCGERDPWYSFSPPPSPDIIYSSGFRDAGPLFLVNELGAKAVGSVHGVFGAESPVKIARELRKIDYQSARFRHARELLKIEVSQMNEILLAMSSASRRKGAR